MSKSTDVDNLADAIVEEFENYTEEVSGAIEEEVKETAKDVKNEIKDRSPRDTGEYADGWARRKTSRGGEIGYTIYNKDKYQLTHLLEKGFVARDGSRVEGQPHIDISYDNNVDQMMKNIEKIIKNGGD